MKKALRCCQGGHDLSRSRVLRPPRQPRTRGRGTCEGRHAPVEQAFAPDTRARDLHDSGMAFNAASESRLPASPGPPRRQAGGPGALNGAWQNKARGSLCRPRYRTLCLLRRPPMSGRSLCRNGMPPVSPGHAGAGPARRLLRLTPRVHRACLHPPAPPTKRLAGCPGALNGAWPNKARGSQCRPRYRTLCHRRRPPLAGRRSLCRNGMPPRPRRRKAHLPLMRITS